MSASPVDARKAFYARIGAYGMTPLWEVLHDLVPAQPATPCVPALWRYETVRPFLLESGELISAREAVRRVLILENPALRGSSSITHTLYAGLQLILPGEVAPSHRHTQSAIRFIVEGEGAYTAVDGERVFMHPGDFIVTPAWTWHDHGYPIPGSSLDHAGAGPVVWLDGLDIPLVRFFDAGFMENGAEEVSSPEGAPKKETFAYPYAAARAALERLRRDAPLDRRHGARLAYRNPVTGGYPTPTMAAFLQWLPRGFAGEPARATDATIYCAVEGRGRTSVAGETLSWGPRDVFVAPSWAEVRHFADADAVLFSLSDRPAQEALGLWREESRP
jgi:gentisate 1,2-dioxygenase